MSVETGKNTASPVVGGPGQHLMVWGIFVFLLMVMRQEKSPYETACTV